MRVQLVTGFQSWKCSDSEFQRWKLNINYCQRDHLPLSESYFEWEQFIDFWHARTFLLEDIGLICSHHQPSNICFHAKNDATTKIVGDSIDGFIALLSEELFLFLRHCEYKYLYQFWMYFLMMTILSEEIWSMLFYLALYAWLELKKSL